MNIALKTSLASHLASELGLEEQIVLKALSDFKSNQKPVFASSKARKLFEEEGNGIDIDTIIPTGIRGIGIDDVRRALGIATKKTQSDTGDFVFMSSPASSLAKKYELSANDIAEHLNLRKGEKVSIMMVRRVLFESGDIEDGDLRQLFKSPGIFEKFKKNKLDFESVKEFLEKGDKISQDDLDKIKKE